MPVLPAGICLNPPVGNHFHELHDLRIAGRLCQLFPEPHACSSVMAMLCTHVASTAGIAPCKYAYVYRVHISSRVATVQIEHDDRCLVIRDAYPKAKFHILVIARDPALLDISCLRAHHVPLLNHMRGKAEAWFSSRKHEVGAVRALPCVACAAAHVVACMLTRAVKTWVGC